MFAYWFMLIYVYYAWNEQESNQENLCPRLWKALILLQPSHHYLLHIQTVECVNLNFKILCHLCPCNGTIHSSLDHTFSDVDSGSLVAIFCIHSLQNYRVWHVPCSSSDHLSKRDNFPGVHQLLIGGCSEHFQKLEFASSRSGLHAGPFKDWRYPALT